VEYRTLSFLPLFPFASLLKVAHLERNQTTASLRLSKTVGYPDAGYTFYFFFSFFLFLLSLPFASAGSP